MTLSWHIAGIAKPLTLYHGVSAESAVALVPETRGDHAFVTTLLLAMREGRDIHVEGEVCPDLLTGLETLQDIWARWRPDYYRRITIRAETEARLVLPPNRGALFAFSGGVDSCYSLFRHINGGPGRNTIRPTAALLVHGMDIPLHQHEMFEGARIRAGNILSDTGIPLIAISTNSRTLGLYW